MERVFSPCDGESCLKLGFKEPRHQDCVYFNMLSAEFCSCACHTEADVAEKLDRIFGYAKGQGVKKPAEFRFGFTGWREPKE
jgi:hypothetical protein